MKDSGNRRERSHDSISLLLSIQELTEGHIVYIARCCSAMSQKLGHDNNMNILLLLDKVLNGVVWDKHALNPTYNHIATIPSEKNVISKVYLGMDTQYPLHAFHIHDASVAYYDGIFRIQENTVLMLLLLKAI